MKFRNARCLLLQCQWILYADPQVAPICRSRTGSITAIMDWILYADLRVDPICRSLTPGVGHSDRGGHRRQGIRQQRPDRDHRRLGCPGDHPASEQPNDPARDRLASLQGKKPFLGSAQTFLRPALLRTPSWFDGESCSPTYYQKVILESAFCWHPTPKMNLRLNDTRLGRMIFITRRTS